MSGGDDADLAWRLARRAGQGALGKALGDELEPQKPKKPSWKKRLLSGGAGLLAAFYVFNKFVPILLPLAFADLLLAGGIIMWSLHVWGVRPLNFFKAKKKAKELDEGTSV